MILYTDGACSKNGSPEARASWAFLEHDNGEVIHEASGLVEGKQSNNTGELMAIKQAMKYAHEKNTEWCVIFSDSLYAINSITLWDVEKKVKGERKMNYDLIRSCQMYYSLPINFQIRWVRGHSVDAMNNAVDRLAAEVLIALKLKEPINHRPALDHWPMFGDLETFDSKKGLCGIRDCIARHLEGHFKENPSHFYLHPTSCFNCRDLDISA